MRYDLMAVVGVLVVMWAVCLGCGLALERLLRLRLDNALLIPLGLCVALVLIMPGYAAGAGDALAVSLLVLVTLAGLVFASGGLRSRLNPGWPGAGGLAVYVLFMLPVIAHGHWTWSGYDFVNDSAFEMLLASHVKGFGTALGNIPESSARRISPLLPEQRVSARHAIAPGHAERPYGHARGGPLSGLHRRPRRDRRRRPVDAHARTA